MRLRDLERLRLPPSADMHVHLRQDKLMKLVVPHIRSGGVSTVFVMPNLQPPIACVSQALDYLSQLQSIEFLIGFIISAWLTSYLYSSITPSTIEEAAAAGIAGVKMYPQGVTTNSESGVTALDSFFPVFEAMEKHDLVLNLHGEVADLTGYGNKTAEEAFLPTLTKLHERFPSLRIVLEHCTTKAAIDAVKACNDNVVATITAHHLYLTSDDTTNPLAVCKPMPKSPADRSALLKAVCSGDPKFFFGSDSAPHPLSTKQPAPGSNGPVPAGVYTQPFATQLVILALEEAIQRGDIAEEDVTQEGLERFLGKNGRQFYNLDHEDGAAGQSIVLERMGEIIPKSVRSKDGEMEVGMSRGGDKVMSLRWDTLIQ